MSNASHKQNLSNVHPIASEPRRRAVSSYGLDFASAAGRPRTAAGCSRCDAVAAVIDGGVSLCGDCYLVEAVRRDAIASPAERMQRAAAALDALRRILDDPAADEN